MSEFVTYIQLYTIYKSKNPGGRKITFPSRPNYIQPLPSSINRFLVRFTLKAGRDGKKISIFRAILQKLS